MLRKSTLSMLIIIVGMILPATLFTQDEGSLKQLYNSIEKLLSQREYEASIPLIEQLLTANPSNANYNFKMAYAIIRGHSDKDPIPYLEKAIQNINFKYKSRYTQDGSPVDALWYYALQRYYKYEYDVAKEYFDRYLSVIPSDHTNYEPCKAYIQWCKTGPTYVQNPVKVIHTNFYAATQLPKFFHSALFSPDESIFIYTAEQNQNIDNYKIEHRSLNDDVFMIYYKDGQWSSPKSISTNINSLRREACIGMHPNGKQLLLYREDPDGGNIYYCDLLDSAIWSAPKKFPAPINSLANESHATISADGSTIYFTSDREGGFGGLDIYMCKLQANGEWGKATNLGSSVNTPYFEESPHLQANSNLLYFSSNRPEGLGEFDVYRCELKADSIAFNVANIGYPINTPRNDMFFKTSIDGGKAYYSSPCKSTNGEYDFMMVEFLDKTLYPNIIIKGIVVNEQGDTLKNIPITLFNLTVKDITDSTKPNRKTGYYTFNLHSKNNYFASIEYDEMVYFSKPFTFSKYYSDYSFSNVIEVDPIVIGDSTMRQDKGSFKVFRQNLQTDEVDEQGNSKNLFTVLEKMPLESVSRTNSTISSKPIFAYTPPKPPIEQTIEPDITLTKPEPEKIETVEKIVEIPTVIEKPKQKPAAKPVAQSKGISVDSLINIGIAVYNQGDYSKSIENFNKAIAIIDTTKDTQTKILGLDYIADAQYNSGQIQQSIETHKQNLSLLEKTQNTTEIKNKQQEIANIYSNLWYQDEAVKYLEKNIEIDEKNKNTEGVSETYQELAEVYLQHNNQEKAIEYLQKGLELSKDAKKKAEAYNTLGVSHHQLQEFTKAIEYYNKAIQTAAKVNDKKGLATYQNNLGNAYFDMQKLEESMIHYKISLGLQQELLDERGAAIALYNIGNVLRLQQKYNAAIDNYMQSIDFALKQKSSDILAKNYFAMVLIYKVIKNYPLALEYYKKYFSIASPFQKDFNVLYNEEEKHAITDGDISLLQTQMKKTEELLKHEKQKYEQELELLKQKENVLKITRIALLIVAIGMFIMLLLLLLRYRTRRKYFKQLSQQNTEILQKQEEIIVQRENLEQMNTLLEKLSIVASKTGNAVAILKPDTSFEWVNSSFEQLYSQRKNSMLNFAYDDDEREKIQHCITQMQSIQYETKRLLTSNNEAWMLCMLTPIIIDGELYKIIVLESDITAQKIAEQKIREQRDEIQIQAKEIEQQRDIAIQQRNEIELQKNAVEKALQDLQTTQKKLIESEKMASLGNLVAGVSHEINTPVGIGIAASTSIKSKTDDILELFTSRKMKQSDLDSYLHSINQAVQLIQSNLKRTGDLVKSFKRVSVDEMTDTMRTFNLKEYIGEILINHEAKLKEKSIEYTIDCPTEIELNSYPGAFAQIISNMTSNALLHAFKNKESGLLTITARTQNNRLYFIFADNGVGMTSEVAQKVFNPFFTTNMQAGTGLGMNIVYNVVTQKLKGDIYCESILDVGTTFKIDIPLVLHVDEQ